MLSKYFAGSPPFRGVKTRDDFPDAFIAVAVEDIVDAHGELHVVVADGALRSARAAIRNVSTYADLDAFVALDSVSSALRSERLWEAMRFLVGYLASHPTAAMEELETALSEALDSEEVFDGTGSDASSVGTVVTCDSPRWLEIDDEEAVDYGGASAWVPFRADVPAVLEVTMSRSEYLALDEDEAASVIISDVNDYVVSFEQPLDVEVYGNLFIHPRDENSFDEERFIADPVRELKLFEITVDGIEALMLSEDADPSPGWNGA